MKRILFLVGITATLFVGCKKEKETPNEEIVSPVNEVKRPEIDVPSTCSFFKPLLGMTTDQQVAWLKEHEGEICKDYLECILESHKMTDEENEVILENIGTNQGTLFTLSDILGQKECNYEYITFTNDGTGKIIKNPSTGFSQTATNYSVPLFHAISKMPNVTSLKFVEASIYGEKRIVFFIDGNNNAFFDYSRWPTLIPAKNPL